MRKKFKVVLNRDEGITGLETAIVLIAFVIVASVLSYVVVSAGLFSSQKAKDAVNAGLQQSSSTIELKSDVVLGMGTTTGATPTPIAEYAYFTVGLVPSGNAVDLTPNPPPGYTDGATPTPDGSTPTPTKLPSLTIISYSDETQRVPSLYWTVQFINANNGDNMLDPGELAQITVYLDPGWYPQYMTTGLTVNSTFDMNIVPPSGPVLPIERKLPSRVSGLIDLQ